MIIASYSLVNLQTLCIEDIYCKCGKICLHGFNTMKFPQRNFTGALHLKYFNNIII